MISVTNFIKVTYFPEDIFFLVNIHIESLPPIFFPPDQEEQLRDVYIKTFFS